VRAEARPSGPRPRAGGVEAVQAYEDTEDFRAVDRVQRALPQGCRHDIAHHATASEKIKAEKCFLTIAGQLPGEENCKFPYKMAEKRGKAADCAKRYNEARRIRFDARIGEERMSGGRALEERWQRRRSAGEAGAGVRHLSTIQALSNKPVGIFATAAIMIALTVVVSAFNVPNPNMILITGLVICASLFGWPGGVTAAVVMMTYTLYFFSTDHGFVAFSEQNMQKVVVSAIGIAVVGFFVSALRVIISREFKQLERMNAELEEDNELLEKATTIDVLTNTNNRFGLRRDFPAYLDREIRVMMMDIDDFKEINDQYGHHMGDYVLSQMGAHLVDIFGSEYVYRYGGDEFLVMCLHAGDDEFGQMTERLRREVSEIALEDTGETISLSAGYTYGTPILQSDLRSMIRIADEQLYESKGAGKNRITGCKFSRSKNHASTQPKGSRGAVEPERELR
jgi:diguanylate cyclase (GGDEF)-like protein